MPRIFRVASLLAVALFAVTLTGLALHLEPPPTHGKPLFQGAQIDEPTLALFQRACQNCHSENTQWPWYSRIPPASWMIGKDVDDARRHVNFSNWDSYRPDEQEDLLTRIGSGVRAPAGCRCRAIRCSIAKRFSRHRSAGKSTNGAERRRNACVRWGQDLVRYRHTLRPLSSTSNRCASGIERQPSWTSLGSGWTIASSDFPMVPGNGSRPVASLRGDCLPPIAADNVR